MVKTRNTPERESPLMKASTLKRLPAVKEKAGPSGLKDYKTSLERQKKLEEENKTLRSIVKDLKQQLLLIKEKIDGKSNNTQEEKAKNQVKTIDPVEVEESSSDEEEGQQWTRVEKNRKNKKGINNEKSKNDKKLDKVPPVVCFSESVKELSAVLKREKVPDDTYSFVRVRNGKYKILTLDEETRQKTVDILKKEKINYFTYAKKGSAMYTTVLKGLEKDEDVSELKSEINNQCGENVVHLVKQVYKNGQKLSVYLVLINKSESVQKVTGIKYLQHLRVKWERYIKKDIVQCFNCQRYGHIAKYCNMKYRCVKCQKEHGPKNCTLQNSEKRDELECVNCKSKGHPASYKGCPVYKTAIERKESGKSSVEVPKQKNDQQSKGKPNQQTEKQSTEGRLQDLEEKMDTIGKQVESISSLLTEFMKEIKNHST